MQKFFHLVLIFLYLVSESWCEIPTPKTYWFDQIVDHFNFANTQTFKQRYLVTDQYFHGSGPLFFYTGNEGPIDSFYFNSGFVFELAEKLNALVIFAEHRYYGQTLPFGKDSWNLHNIGYLSVEQALADYAILIPTIKSTYKIPDSPVVAFGGSYGGMLAAWFRMKYPTVVHAALAASAPIPVTETHTMKPRYFETTTKSLAMGDPKCPDLVRKGFNVLLDLAAQGESGLKKITESFSLCKPLTTDADVQHLVGWIVNSFGSMAMMNYPYPTNFLAPLPAWPMKYACKVLLQNSDPLQALAQAAGLFYNGTGGTLDCFDIYSEFVFCADQTGCGTGPDGMSWDYQVCTEIVYFPNTNNVTDMFPPRNWTMDDLVAYCKKVWNVVPRPDWLTTEFGGSNIKYASNIIFSNGLLDPWHGGGFLNNITSYLVAFIIEDGAHHLDLRASNPLDPQSVISARAEEENAIRNFIYQKKQNN